MRQARARRRRVGKVACWSRAYVAPALRDFAHAVEWRDWTAWAKAHESLPELRSPAMRLCPPYKSSQIDRDSRRRNAAEDERMSSILVYLIRGYLKLTAASLLAFGAALSPAFAPAPASGRPIVAVLPLENNSGDAAQDFFAEAMTDEIATALAGVPGIAIVARSSSFQLNQPHRHIKAIGAALDASHLVHRSARLADDRVRLSVAVAQAGDGAQLWSKEFEAPRSGVFDLEEEVARNIVAALKAPPNPDQVLVRTRARDFAVYLDFLRANAAGRPRGAGPMA